MGSIAIGDAVADTGILPGVGLKSGSQIGDSLPYTSSSSIDKNLKMEKQIKHFTYQTTSTNLGTETQTFPE